MLLIWLLMGFLLGLFIARIIFRNKPMGSLKIMQSDGESYLFLELDSNHVDDFYKKKTVCFNVKTQKHISPK